MTDTTFTDESADPDGDTKPRQVAEGVELWNVDGSQFLVYLIPDTDIPLVWRIEDPDRIEAIWGEVGKEPDRTLSQADFESQSPVLAGLSAEIRNTSDDPWQQFFSDYEEAAALRPWLKDPEMLAVTAVAYLEGRTPTRDELSQTDWWQDHSAAERQWLETSVTAGQDEIKAQRDDRRRAVGSMFRQAGIATATPSTVAWVADRWLTGEWSESKVIAQIRGLADPGFGVSTDPRLAKFLETQEQMDRTRSQEDAVSEMVVRWLGPTMGQWSDNQIEHWAGRLRNDPDAELELKEMLQQQRFALFPTYQNLELTYEDIVSPVRNLATNIWGQAAPDETMLVDLANLGDYTEMAKRLRKQGLDKGIAKVTQDAMSGLRSTSLGEQVVRSTI